MSGRTITMISLLVLCATIAAGAQAVTITAGDGIPAVDQTETFTIMVDEFPQGLLGFNITARLGDPSKAEIVGIILPIGQAALRM